MLVSRSALVCPSWLSLPNGSLRFSGNEHKTHHTLIHSLHPQGVLTLRFKCLDSNSFMFTQFKQITQIHSVSLRSTQTHPTSLSLNQIHAVSLRFAQSRADSPSRNHSYCLTQIRRASLGPTQVASDLCLTQIHTGLEQRSDHRASTDYNLDCVTQLHPF